MIEHISLGITSLLTLISGGGWFVFWRLNRHLKSTDAAIQRAEFYSKMLDDLQERIIKQQNEISIFERKVVEFKKKIAELEDRCKNCKYQKKKIEPKINKLTTKKNGKNSCKQYNGTAQFDFPKD